MNSSTMLKQAILNSSIIEDSVGQNNETATIIAFEKESRTYIYQGGAPPSYWDSPISASQLIVTCILLVILCGIYTYSNFDSRNSETPLLKPARNPSVDASELMPLQAQEAEDQRRQGVPANMHDMNAEKPLLPVTLADIENRLQQLENYQSTDDWHGELSVTREKLERIIQWLNSCPSPGTFHTFKHSQANEV